MNAVGTCLLALGLWAAADRDPSSARRLTGYFTLHGAGITPAPGKSEAPKGEKKRKPRFTVGKETTYVTGPLCKDGYIDYVAALNERLSKGVTPENNANVLFWKAFGPRPEGGPPMPPAFFKWLGYQPPERGDYFVGLVSYIKKRFQIDEGKQADKFNEQLERAAQRPWTVTDYPHIASWLKANAHPLALVVEGTRRSHYYSPHVPGRPNQRYEYPGLLGAPIPGVSKCRELATALAARAMLRAEEGRYDDAWQDLLACHRLGRLVGRGSLFETLVGIAIEAIATRADLAYLERAKLSGQRLKDRLRDLQQLPPMPPLADAMDLCERCTFFDVTMRVAREGKSALLNDALIGVGPPLDKAIDAVEQRYWDNINWDVICRNGNRWYDRIAVAMRRKDRREREPQLILIEDDLKTLAVKLGDREKLARAILSANGRAKSKILEGFLRDLLILRLTAGIIRLQQSTDSAEQIRTNLYFAFALAAYKQDHGRYPKKLKALAPKYLPEIPQDMFSGKALIYRPSEKSYLLYSVGVNGQDEQGRSDEDDPPGDDLVVRMPLPPLRRP
jgi:hypothetical protein